MAGIKTFVNTTGAALDITLFIRAGFEPYNQYGTESFTLGPYGTEEVAYGDDNNKFLNGILIFTIFEGDLYSKMQFVVTVESDFDALINTNSTLTYTLVNTDYVISGSN
ncbi:hypothetical protein [Paenibacillus sp. CF384]|uniref:hypothetical protein n=1 Tax=Paenibacillus sp. CF384 TaxID=1884382 RepID=UPI00089C5D42|nr:hypothetical protein [Paenibacillus sp. CF384]SDX56348.1 hypothetical protein SAMN05518855_1016100 [Paenibacillus sp. CF384]